MHLPDMDGEAVMLALRADAQLCHVPVVVVSADATGLQMRTMQDLGVRAYLTKPLALAETLQTIDSCLLDGAAAPGDDRG